MSEYMNINAHCVANAGTQIHIQVGLGQQPTSGMLLSHTCFAVTTEATGLSVTWTVLASTCALNSALLR